MRASKREIILDAIVDLIERDGIGGLTFDAVAARTGITRGGLMYHFPSREALVLATHRHMAERWEKDMSEALGEAAAQAPAAERHAAYVRISSRAATRGELLLMLESSGDATLGQIWVDVGERWAPPVPGAGDPAALKRFIARLAADGLWMYDALSPRPIPPDIRDRISAELVAMIETAAD
jgi:AcrR family transcriptional regulator